MVNFVEKTFQVHIDNVLIACIDILFGFQDGLLSILVGAKTITVCVKTRLELDRYRLAYCLLKKSVQYGGNTQKAGFSITLGNAYSQNGLSKVCPRMQ